MSVREWGERGGGDAPPPQRGAGNTDDMGVTPESVRVLAGSWSLAGDRNLLKLLENIHQTIVLKSEQINDRMERMCAALDNASVSLQNVNNRFNSLSNSQFIESRVYDDDVTVSGATETAATPVTEAPEPRREAPTLSSTLGEYYDEVRIAAESDSDSDRSDAEDSVVLQPRNLYAHRPLPHVIGSRAWTARPHAGLIEEESDSDISVDKREREDEEQYSSSDSLEADTDLPPREIRRDEDAYSGETAMSEDSASQAAMPAVPSQPPAKPSPADFAAELARRLGGAEPPPAPVPRAPPAPRAPAAALAPPSRNLPGHVFCDEPPPIEVAIEDDIIEDQDQDDDDIFADLHNTNIFNRNTNIFNKNTQPNRQSYGGLFDDLLPANDCNRNATDTSTDIFNDNARVFVKKDLDKKTGASDKDNDNLGKTHNVLNKNDALSRSGLFDDDEDDLFADIGVGDIQTVSKMSDSKLSNQNLKGLFDDDDDQDGNIFTEKKLPGKIIDVIKITPPDQTKGVTVKESEQTENKNVSKLSPEEISNTSNPITTLKQNIGVKKPVGGISLFGNKQGAESIGAAVLKHARRKLSSSSEDIESEPIEETKTANINKYECSDKNDDSTTSKYPVEDVFTDLFAISKKDKQNKEEVVKKNNPNEKFDDLFAQSSMREYAQTIKNNNESSIFADDVLNDDDIFRSNVKHSRDKLSKIPVAKDNAFDGNDDLFSDIQEPVIKSKEKTKNIERPEEYKSSSLSHDDDIEDLFSTQLVEERSLNSPKLVQEKDIVNSPNLKKYDVKSKSPESAKETEHLSFKSSQDNKKGKLKENTKSLESDFIPAEKTVHEIKNELVTSIIKVTPAIDKLDIAPVINDLFGNDGESFFDTKSSENKEIKSIDKLKTTEKKGEYNSPLLFPDDELEDLFATSLVQKKSSETPEFVQDVHKDTKKDAGLENADLKNKEISISKETEHIENKNDKLYENSNFPALEFTQSKERILKNSTIEAQNKLSHSDKPTLKTKPLVINHQSNHMTSQKTCPEPLSGNQSSELHIEKSEIQDKTPDTMDNTANQESSVFSKLERPGDDFFDTIFEDQPPAFQKPTEPKKSKNVNALFDDDSDDDGLFLKKHDNLSLTNSDDAKSIDELLPPTDDKLFDEFHSESPHLDEEIVATNIKSHNFMEGSPQMTEKKLSLGNKGPKRTMENTLTASSKETKTDHSFEDLEYVKIVCNEDGQKYQEIISTKFDPPRNPGYISNPIETGDRAEQSKNNQKYDILNTKEAIEGRVDSQSNIKAKSIGKLKPINLNINVHKLLPGASPKKINRPEMSNLETPDLISGVITPQIDDVDNTIATIVKSVSFEKGPVSPILVNTYSKERAKIQVKRRPSSRKARKDAIRKSAVDLDFDSDFSESVDVTDNFTTSLPTSPLEVSNSLVSNLKVNHPRADTIQLSKERKEKLHQESAGSSSSSTAKISTLGKVYAECMAKDSETNSELENSFESKRSGNSDDEDLFSFNSFASSNKDMSVTVLEIEKEKDLLFKKDPLLIKNNNAALSSKLISQKTDAEFIAPTKHYVERKSEENIFVSDDSDLDELFKSSKNPPKSVVTETKSEVSRTHTNTLGEIAGNFSNTSQIKGLEPEISKLDKTKEEKPFIVQKQSLFEDDIGDDDLFGVGVNTGAMRKLRETKIENIHGREKVTSHTDNEDLFFSKKKEDFSKKSGKKSLFGDDDSDEDIFGCKSKTTKASDKSQKTQPLGETSQATTTSAEEVFDDPLSLFK